MTNTSTLKFTLPAWQTHEPSLWFKFWAGLYESTKSRQEDNRVYYTLIAKGGQLQAGDFEIVGRWKEGCLSVTNGRWKPNTTAGFEVWMQVKQALPTCPKDDSVPTFLTQWSDIEFTTGIDKNTQKICKQKFGLPRASTLLHFISGGRFPIFDSRVRRAIKRLGSSPPTKLTAKWYFESFCPLFKEIANLCGASSTTELRLLDNALFCYGGGIRVSLEMIDNAVSLGKSSS
jgi:hypothetical protein